MHPLLLSLSWIASSYFFLFSLSLMDYFLMLQFFLLSLMDYFLMLQFFLLSLSWITSSCFLTSSFSLSLTHMHAHTLSLMVYSLMQHCSLSLELPPPPPPLSLLQVQQIHWRLRHPCWDDQVTNSAPVPSSVYVEPSLELKLKFSRQTPMM